jgi:hypothetical protein
MDIKSYLKYYIGCDCKITVRIAGNQTTQSTEALSPTILNELYIGSHVKDVKPILRRISSLTEEERVTLFGESFRRGIFDTTLFYTVKEFDSLINIGVWLFGDKSFEDGTIIDKDNFLPKQ